MQQYICYPVLIWITVLAVSACNGFSQSEPDQEMLKRLQEKMIKDHLAARGIQDESILGAMRKVERHRFVPEPLRVHAYDDTALPIRDNQTISQPYIVALMTELLQPKKEHNVLEIGTGSGYQAAVLAELVNTVFTIEIIETLGRQAKTLLLDELKYTNIQCRIGDGYQGWKEHAPYDGIIVTAAPGHVPQPLVQQLKPGGRMVIPVGEQNQQLLLITKDEDGVKQETIIPVRFVPMTGEAQEK